MVRTTGQLNRMLMQHRIRTAMSPLTRVATTAPFRVRGVDTEEVTGAVDIGAATETFLRHSGHTHPVRMHRSRRSFEKGGNV
jgi:hypothetical protein